MPPELGVGRGASATEVLTLREPEAASAHVAVAQSVVEHVSVPLTHVNGSAELLKDWEAALEAQAIEMLESGKPEVWDTLTRRFESRLILAALGNTRGRRIEAAQKLGIGRNTITRKIQELGLE